MPDKEKKTLTVTSIGSAGEYNNNPVIQFAAVDQAGESKGYETWGRELVDLVQKDAVLNAEVTCVQKGDQVTNRVTQMFDVQGKPIRPSQRRSGGGYGAGSSPEDRVSRDNQARAYIISDLWKSGKLEDNDSRVKKLLSWLDRMGETAPAPAPAPAQAAAKAAPPPTQPATARAAPPPTTPPAPEAEGKPLADITESDIPDLRALFQICFLLWEMPSIEACQQLGYGSVTDASEAGLNLWDSWLIIKDCKEGPKA